MQHPGRKSSGFVLLGPVTSQVIMWWYSLTWIQFRVQGTQASKVCLLIAGGPTFSLTAQLPCDLRSYWGVNIKDIFPIIHQPWYLFTEQVMEGRLLEGACLASQEVLQYPFIFKTEWGPTVTLLKCFEYPFFLILNKTRTGLMPVRTR